MTFLSQWLRQTKDTTRFIMQTPSTQLALTLFDDLDLRGSSVAKAPHDLGFKRSDELIKIVDLSLAARRFIDVAYFFVAVEPTVQREYRVDYSLFKWLMGTTSNNRGHMTKIIREGQMSAIVINEISSEHSNMDRWGSVPLMGAAFIANGEITFELPERLQKAIKNPISSHFLSLRYVFRSIYARILFDRIQVHLAEGLTPWYALADLRIMLECTNKTYDAWKHFKSRVLATAIAEIKELTGLELELLTLNAPGSKKVAKARFRIITSLKASEQNMTMLVLKNLYDTLKKEFSLTTDEFNEITVNRAVYTDEAIHQAMDYTRHQVKMGKVKLRAGGYFMRALREGYLLGSLDKQIQEKLFEQNSAQTENNAQRTKQQERQAATVKDQTDEKVARGWAVFERLSPEQQQELMQTYSNELTSKAMMKRFKIAADQVSNYLDHPMLRKGFGLYVAIKFPEALEDLLPQKTARRPVVRAKA